MTDDVLCVRVSPNGKLLAAALLDSTVRVFFLDSLKFFLSLYGHKLPVLSMDISSGGCWVLGGRRWVGLYTLWWDGTGGHGRGVMFCGAAMTGRPKGRAACWTQPRAACFTPLCAPCALFLADSTLLVTGSADKNIKVWGLDFGDCHRSLFAHADSVMAVAFVPNTHYLFTAGARSCRRPRGPRCCFPHMPVAVPTCAALHASAHTAVSLASF